MAEPQTNFELTIEKLVYGGEGLGRMDGQVVFAPYVLPGESVRVERKSEKSGLVRTALREVQLAPEKTRALPARQGLALSLRAWRIAQWMNSNAPRSGFVSRDRSS